MSQSNFDLEIFRGGLEHYASQFRAPVVSKDKGNLGARVPVGVALFEMAQLPFTVTAVEPPNARLMNSQGEESYLDMIRLVFTEGGSSRGISVSTRMEQPNDRQMRSLLITDHHLLQSALSRMPDQSVPTPPGITSDGAIDRARKANHQVLAAIFVVRREPATRREVFMLYPNSYYDYCMTQTRGGSGEFGFERFFPKSVAVELLRRTSAAKPKIVMPNRAPFSLETGPEQLVRRFRSFPSSVAGFLQGR